MLPPRAVMPIDIRMHNNLLQYTCSCHRPRGKGAALPFMYDINCSSDGRTQKKPDLHLFSMEAVQLTFDSNLTYSAALTLLRQLKKVTIEFGETKLWVECTYSVLYFLLGHLMLSWEKLHSLPAPKLCPLALGECLCCNWQKCARHKV